MFSVQKNYYQNIANNFRLSDPSSQLPSPPPPPDIDGRTFFSKRVSDIQIVHLFEGFSKPLSIREVIKYCFVDFVRTFWCLCTWNRLLPKKCCFCPLNETEKHMNTYMLYSQTKSCNYTLNISNFHVSNPKLKRALIIGVAYISFTCP